jgi:hypothetical protein
MRRRRRAAAAAISAQLMPDCVLPVRDYPRSGEALSCLSTSCWISIPHAAIAASSTGRVASSPGLTSRGAARTDDQRHQTDRRPQTIGHRTCPSANGSSATRRALIDARPIDHTRTGTRLHFDEWCREAPRTTEHVRHGIHRPRPGRDQTSGNHGRARLPPGDHPPTRGVRRRTARRAQFVVPGRARTDRRVRLDAQRLHLLPQLALRVRRRPTRRRNATGRPGLRRSRQPPLSPKLRARCCGSPPQCSRTGTP